MAGAAGSGGIPVRDDRGERREIDNELVDLMAIADNIHDFSGDRSNIPIRTIVNGRLIGNKYLDNLRYIIRDNEKKPNNFEKQIQWFLEQRKLVTPVIEDIFNYNSPEHTRFIDCSDNDLQNLEKVKGRDCVVFRVLVSRDKDRNKYIDYINRQNLLFGLDMFFKKAKLDILGNEYLPIIYDASSFSPKNIFYILKPNTKNIITGVFGGILVEEATHSDSATKIANINYRESCNEVPIDKLFNGETITYSMNNIGSVRKGIKLLVNHQNFLRENRLTNDIQIIRSLERIDKVIIPSDGPFKYYLINSNDYCSAGIIIETRDNNLIVKTSIFGGQLFSVEAISNYYNGIIRSDFDRITEEFYNRIFDLLGIRDREIRLKILMDLKRCGDWGQVMMIKKSGNKAVLYTHDRMLFNFARYQQVPVIFTGFPNVNVEDEEDNNNSLYVDLVCYTPDINGEINMNIANIIALAQEGIEREKLMRGLETLRKYRKELIDYFLKEVRPFKIPNDLILLNNMIGKLKKIIVRRDEVDISVGIPDNLIYLLFSFQMFISIINYSYRVFIDFYNEIDRITTEIERVEIEGIRERINRQFTNYNILITMKNIRIIVKNLTTLFSEIGETEDYELKTVNINKLATSLFLGINLNSFFSNILYSVVYRLENPQFTRLNFYNQLQIIVPIFKSLIENNKEVENKERLNLNNEGEYREYINYVIELTSTEDYDRLYEEMRRLKPIERRILRVSKRKSGGGLEVNLEDYKDLENVKVYYYTYFLRLYLEAIIINDSENIEILQKQLNRFNYYKILGIIGGNIIENNEPLPEDFFEMKPYEIIRGLEPEMLNNSPNTQLYIYTILVNEYINNYRNPDIEVIIETIDYLGLVYSEMIGIASINIVIGDAVLDEERTRPIDIPEVIIEKETRKRLLEPEEIEIIRPTYEVVDEFPEELRLEKPSILYSEIKRPRITAPGGELYDGGKIRIMKKSMKDIYLDELEKNIIRWGIKKGYIHKSNYLDLEKLLKN